MMNGRHEKDEGRHKTSFWLKKLNEMREFERTANGNK